MTYFNMPLFNYFFINVSGISGSLNKKLGENTVDVLAITRIKNEIPNAKYFLKFFT